jgi:Flp pilus assembly protein TadD
VPDVDGIGRADALLTMRRPAQAEEVIRACLSAEPGDPLLLVLLARALLQQDKYAQAQTAARAALTHDPTSPQALSCLAEIAAHANDFDDGSDYVDRALSLAPLSAGLHRQKAAILLLADRPEEALKSVSTARSLAPDDAEIAALNARILLRLGRRDQAGSEVRRALALEPMSATVHATAGLHTLRQGHTAESIVRYREALRIDPTDAAAREGLALALKARNPVFAAVLRLESWMELQPKGRQWIWRLSPLVLSRIAYASSGPVRIALLVVVAVLLAATWFSEPIGNLTLMTRPHERVLLSRPARRSAMGFAMLAVGAIILISFATDRRALGGIGIFVGLLAAGVGHLHTIDSRKALRVAYATTAVALAGAASALGFEAVGGHAARTASFAVLIIGSAATLWVVALN